MGARYLPGDDTRLLKEALMGRRGESCLEMGFGSGALLAAVSAGFATPVGTDLMELAEARLAAAPGVDLVISDRATCFRDEAFDLVFFNPPYLPSVGVEDRTVDGGLGGVEVPMSFLGEAVRVMKRGGNILVLLSDRGDIGSFLSMCERLGLSESQVAEKKLFFERLVVYRLERSGGRESSRG